MELFDVRIVRTGETGVYDIDALVSLFKLNRDILRIPVTRTIIIKESKLGKVLISRREHE